MYSSAALRTVTVLCNHHHPSPELSSCKTETLSPLNTNFPFPLPPASSNPHCIFCLYEFDSSKYITKVYHPVFVILCLACFIRECLQGSSMFQDVSEFLPLWGWIYSIGWTYIYIKNMCIYIWYIYDMYVHTHVHIYTHAHTYMYISLTFCLPIHVLMGTWVTSTLCLLRITLLSSGFSYYRQTEEWERVRDLEI